MTSSPRKHLREGPWRTTFRNILILSAYHLGVSPRYLHQLYYHQSKTTQNPKTPLITQETLL
ncbi:MAG: hypothetical protein HC904_05870 [Blastochloris sp.]|nr:hypothetical protein [Blastochloris sp.]